VEARLGYTAYAQTGTPLMRGNLGGFTPECGYFRRTAATVPPGLRWSCRRQGLSSQCEKPASTIADDTDKVFAYERDAALNQNLYPKWLNQAKEIFSFSPARWQANESSIISYGKDTANGRVATE
jgi:hypothetical protein